MFTMQWWNGFQKSNFFRHFMPFMILVVGGSFALKEFTALRYRYRNTEMIDVEKYCKEKGIELDKTPKVTLESEYEKLKQADLDQWENVRIPRPWEEEGQKQ